VRTAGKSGAETGRSYRLTEIALQADPKNQKALSDLPLLAFKTGRIGAAAEAASMAIEKSTSGPAQASAWFNLGLVCEQVLRALNSMALIIAMEIGSIHSSVPGK